MQEQRVARMNIHLYPSNFTHESRMLRETGGIGKLGFFAAIVIVAIWESGLQERERLDDRRQVWRVRLRTPVLPDFTPMKIIKHVEWTLRILLRFGNAPVGMVNCHNLSSLLAGVLLKAMTRAVLVYDTHELETERTGWSRRRRTMARLFERAVIRRVDLVITVTESIAEWYRNSYSLHNVHAVYNFPQVSSEGDSSHACDLKKIFKISSDEVLFIYQGVLREGRGAELLLDVFSGMSADKHIVFMGYGPLEGKVVEYCERFRNIHFQPAVKPEDVVKYVGSADVGLYLIENASLSYYLTLGNKFAECIVAGLPVLTVDFPETARIVDAYDCGWKVALERVAVSDLIGRLSVEEIRRKKESVLRCQDSLKWEKEEVKMLKAYEMMLGSSPADMQTMRAVE